MRKFILAGMLSALAMFGFSQTSNAQIQISDYEPVRLASFTQDDAAESTFKDWIGKMNIGAGLRTNMGSSKASGGDRSYDFNLDNLRLYMNSSGHDVITLEFNTDINNAQGFGVGTEAGEVRVLDAIAKFKLSDQVNIWIGRMLPPSDRSNLSGPYYLNAWTFPWVQFGYHNIFQGRDDGILAHGKLKDGRWEYAIGAFEGKNVPTGDDNMMIAGRFNVNLLDVEDGFYNSSTYYGSMDILTAGFAFQNQNGTDIGTGDYDSYSFDVLYERPTEDGGAVTVEGAYYDFTGTQSTNDGNSYFVMVSRMSGSTTAIGPATGRLVPYYRHQNFDRDAGAASDQIRSNDFGVHMLMNGHNSRFTLEYSKSELVDGSSREDVRFGYQLQF
ncbi:MAG: hypothetical protein VX738_05455 [Planctomycetota bacterium]|nr:hypothetical protein [Planctomycetota bacterium]